MNVTPKQISEMIAEYKEKGYGEDVKGRNWTQMYIHAPHHKFFINGEPTCKLWKRLVAAHLEELRQIGSFDVLLQQLSKMQKHAKIKGIGELTLYDTATCIGCEVRVLPEFVYLHAGAKTGAEAIFGKERIKQCNNMLSKQDFVDACAAFGDLEPLEIEDFLCFYHLDLEDKDGKGRENGVKMRKNVEENKHACVCCC